MSAAALIAVAVIAGTGPVRVYQLETPIAAFAVAPDGKQFAVARDGNWIDIYDANTGEVRHAVRFNDGDKVAALAFSPNGKTLAASARFTNLVRAWAADTGAERFAVPAGPNDGNRALAFSPDGTVLAVGGEDGQIRLLDPADGRKRATVGKQVSPPVAALAFHPSGRLLASAHPGTRLGHVWRVEDPPGWTASFLGHGHDGGTASPSLAFSPDGRSLLAVTGDRVVRLLELATREPRWDMPVSPPVGAVAVTPGSPWVAVVGPADDRVRLRDRAPGGVRLQFRGHRGGVLAVAFAGGRLYTAGDDQTVRVWAVPVRDPPAPVRLPARDVDRLGADLAGPNAGEAYRAIHELAADPAAAVQVARNRLHPAGPPDPAVIAEVRKLVADLGRDEFDVREAASRRLGRLAPAVRAEILKARKAATDPEVIYRLDGVIRGAALTAASAITAARCLELLERVNTPAAREVVRSVAAGDPDDPLTQDAADTLGRMTRRIPANR